VALPTSTIAAIADLCIVIADNATLRNGIYRAGAARLAKKIEAAIEAKQAAELVLSGEEIILAVNMAEAVVQAIVAGGKPIVSPMVLIRICERVVEPITDALGYPG
jgi:hypothetical protein